MGNKNFTIHPFEKLKKRIAQKQVASPALSQKKEEYVAEEDLFIGAMDDVKAIEAFRRLSCERRLISKVVSSATSRDPDDEALAIIRAVTEGKHPINLPDTQEYVEWTNPDYGSFLTEQLHEGRFSVQDCLDLHGFTVREAEAEMDAFLQKASARGLRCVKIIHGRGLRSLKGPRIKDLVVRRLLGHYRHGIMAYVSARQCDGGLGAVYVLLARR